MAARGLTQVQFWGVDFHVSRSWGPKIRSKEGFQGFDGLRHIDSISFVFPKLHQPTNSTMSIPHMFLADGRVRTCAFLEVLEVLMSYWRSFQVVALTRSAPRGSFSKHFLLRPKPLQLRPNSPP